MENVLNVTLPFFAIVACGYLGARLKLFSTDAIGGLNALVWYFALPCLIFRAIALRPVAEILDIPFVAGWAMGAWAVYLVTGLLGRALFRVPLGAALLQGQAAALSNIGFMGIPLLIALIGEKAAVPAVLAMLTNQILLQTPTIALLEYARNRQGHPLITAGKVLKGFILNPLVLSAALAAAVAWSGVTVPSAVDSFTGFLGRAAGPCALFSIGAKLAGRPVTDGFAEASFIAFCKLFLHPLAVWVVMFHVLPIDPERATIAVLSAALPIGGNVFVLAQKFDMHAARISSAILVSTAGAALTFAFLAAHLVP